MSAPFVQWYDGNNTKQQTEWPIGVVDAGTVSVGTTFMIWNNRQQSSDVSDMTNCTITTKDILGSNTGEVVTNRWIEARLSNEGTFTPIGGAVTKSIHAEGAGTGRIKGTKNDGSVAAASNYCKVELHANVPATATAGNFTFLTRVAYQYT
ncbi:hypothetical protein [Paenibacillus arenosi]|uniref:Phage tail protein n=1 Tax=Paenibacillus arenosi TaxID=2774142 RepID=A0ABR9B0A7_9BACL|nr:hypothetical protein [Paenibacillus arenosi]MBD8498877.1 hypothetical protein [Paenibacillus arenosi]